MNECKKEKRGGICFYNCDNIEFMKSKPDNYYDLAIVDPPYGLDDWNKRGSNKKHMDKKHMDLDKIQGWELKPPQDKYFNELKRVSKNQIIWGGNHFLDYLGSTKEFIVWDKKIRGMHFNDCELAWSSGVKAACRIFSLSANQLDRIHPTQKPIMLYRWVLQNYSESGMKILDTHGGSHTHAIAADMENRLLDIVEIDQKYFNDGLNAFDEYKRQLKLF